MRLSTALELGRVSNLPTVWTNVLAAIYLMGGANTGTVFLAMLAVSFLYLAGMFLNDACDAQWDARNKQSRPIVRGDVTRKQVFIFAGAFAVVAVALLLFAAAQSQRVFAGLFAGALVCAIVLYDFIHKQWSHSAWIMGSCRLLVYLVAASLVALPTIWVAAAGVSLLVYIAGITYLARAEHVNRVNSFWPVLLLLTPLDCAAGMMWAKATLDAISVALLVFTLGWIWRGVRFLRPGENRHVPTAIGTLLAGLCLIDACFLAVSGHGFAVAFCVIAFALCLWLQKKVAAS